MTIAGATTIIGNNKLIVCGPGTIITQGNNNMKWIRNIIERVRLEIRYRKKLKELRKRDPFIYK